MKLRVNVHVPIPHKVLIGGVEVSFAPDAEVPDDWGTAMLKDFPNIYIQAKGDADLTKYRTRETSLIAGFHEKFDALTEEERVKTLKYMDDLQAKRVNDAKVKQAKEEDDKRKALRAEEEAQARAKKEGRV